MKKSKYHLELGVTASCTKRVMEPEKGLGQSNGKNSTNVFFFLAVSFPQRGRLKLLCMMFLT